METGSGEVRDITVTPTVIIVDRNGKRETLTEQASTREEVTALIIKHFHFQKKGSFNALLPPAGTKQKFMLTTLANKDKKIYMAVFKLNFCAFFRSGRYFYVRFIQID